MISCYLVMAMSGQQSSSLRRIRLAGKSSVIITKEKTKFFSCETSIRIFWCNELKSFKRIMWEGFCLGWLDNFVGSEFFLVRYRVLNSRRMWSPTQLEQSTPPTPSQPHTACMDFGKGRGGGDEQERKLEGQLFPKLGRKYRTDCISSL